MLALRRISTRRTVSVRSYTIGRSEGSVAQSQGFSKKEKAHEDQYVHKHEMEQLQKLKESIAKKEAELANLKGEHAALEASAEKK